MAKVHRIKIEPLTAEGFRPFGLVMSAQERPPDETVDGGLKARWGVDFHTGGTISVTVNRVAFQGLTFSKMERHFNVTQSAIPLEGPPAVVAVAAPTDPDDREAIPGPEKMHAFLIDGTRGYVLGKGTWHSLNRFPLYPDATTFIILSDEETFADLRLGYAGKGGFKLTQEVDYEAKFGVTFEMVL